MAIPIEQITAPGKWEYDLAMEEIEAELKKSTPKYSKLKDKLEREDMPKNGFYYISPNTRVK